MKTLMICLLVISSVMIIGNAAEMSGSGKHLDPGAIPDHKEKTYTPVHDYRRGCQKSQHCRPE